MLFEAQMTEVAAFDFLSGSVAVFTTRSPQKETSNEDVAALWPVGPTSGVLAAGDGAGAATPAESEPAGLPPKRSKNRCKRRPTSIPAANWPIFGLAVLHGIEAANRSVRELCTLAATTLGGVEIHDRTI